MYMGKSSCCLASNEIRMLAVMNAMFNECFTVLDLIGTIVKFVHEAGPEL